MRDTSAGKLWISPTVIAKAMPPGAILVDSATGDCFELNRVGAQVWERLQHGDPLEAIVDALAREYSLESSVISTDVAALMEDLARHGILVAHR